MLALICLDQMRGLRLAILLDFFAGSNTTGAAAEEAGRNWIAFEQEKPYLLASAFRFIDREISEKQVGELYQNLMTSAEPLYLPQTKQGRFTELMEDQKADREHLIPEGSLVSR